MWDDENPIESVIDHNDSPLSKEHEAIREDLIDLNRLINHLFQKHHYDGQFSVDESEEDPTDKIYLDYISRAFYLLDQVTDCIYNLKCPLVEGPCYLHKNNRGKWETPEGRVLSCGSGVEVWPQSTGYEDDYSTGWIDTRIEHISDKGYCVWATKEPVTENTKVRIRQAPWLLPDYNK